MRLAARPLALLLCAILLGGCGNTLQVQPVAHQALEGLVVAPFPVYWLGEHFDGLEVSETSHDPSDAYAVNYGNCIQGGQGYCVPPLRVVTSPDNSFVPGGTLPMQSRKLRGVSARLAQRGKTILIATGPVVVDIYADSASLARLAAGELAPINAPGAPGQTLPARQPDNGFEAKPLPTQVPDPLRALGVPLDGRG